MSNKLPYEVPSGYFEDLKFRLAQIPAAEGLRRQGSRSRVVRYLAIAASVAVGILIGVHLQDWRDAATTEEDALVEYLIDSGTTLAQIVNAFE